MAIIVRNAADMREDFINGRYLYPSKSYKRFASYSGNLYDDGGGFYRFDLYNQLPGLMGEGLNVPGFSAHYKLRFNPETGEIQYLKFADYGGFTNVVEVCGEMWAVPENPILCTYLRKVCRDAWEGAYLSKIIEVETDENGQVKYKRRAPVNIHTGEPYRNCYRLLVLN